MVGDQRQVALSAAVGDLVDADLDEALEPSLVEVVADDALDDPPDRVPAHAREAGDRRLRHLLGKEGGEVLEVARVAGAGSCPGHRLDADTAVGAAHSAQAVLDKAALGAEVEVAPAPHGAVVDRADHLATARAGHASAPQRDLDDHAVGGERDVDDPGARERQESVECGGDAHAVLLGSRLPLNSQQPSRAGGCASSGLAQLPRGDQEGRFPVLCGDYGRLTRGCGCTRTSGDPEIVGLNHPIDAALFLSGEEAFGAVERSIYCGRPLSGCRCSKASGRRASRSRSPRHCRRRVQHHHPRAGERPSSHRGSIWVRGLLPANRPLRPTPMSPSSSWHGRSRQG